MGTTGLLYSNEATFESEPDSMPPLPQQSSPSQESDPQQHTVYDRPLENRLDVGIYKVGQNPLQKKLKSGRMVTLISMGMGGIRNNRRLLDNEDPREYANHCAIQWDRISVHPVKLGGVVIKNVVLG